MKAKILSARTSSREYFFMKYVIFQLIFSVSQREFT